jgi:hypothetical protein
MLRLAEHAPQRRMRVERCEEVFADERAGSALGDSPPDARKLPVEYAAREVKLRDWARQSSKSGRETARSRRASSSDHAQTRRFDSGYGSGFSRTDLTTVKRLVPAPIRGGIKTPTVINAS